MIRPIHLAIFAVFTGACLAGDWKPADFIAPTDAGKPIMIPTAFHVSKIGKGSYRLDGPDSKGKVNCIFLHFEPGDPKLTEPGPWKEIEDKTFPDGTVIRERVIKNPFGGTGGDGTAWLRVRVTAKDAGMLDRLVQIADSIIKP